ncbi:hypothetical protein CLV58_101206 [Spirosoma oryzae]|uniref:Uncharacterized protein n=1 Tax=Spirosoma oryzae TaxID=1469603 RepID=A0A2T0TN50_9BACT|nr:hypothetical protein CLV58_101206 [Spirosoma oryzae]
MKKRRRFKRVVPYAVVEGERIISAQPDLFDPSRVDLVLRQGCLNLRKTGILSTNDLQRLGIANV